VLPDADPASRKRAWASGAVNPLRSVRATAEQPPATASAGLCVHRHTGRGQGLEVTTGGGERYLQLVGQFARGQLAAGLKEKQGGHETVGAHAPILRRKVIRR
jgi:hypothetical protein